MKTAIIGCGYAGRVLAHRLIERGNPVRATTTSEARLSSLATLGAEPVVLRVDHEDALARTLDGVEAVVYLAPPAKDQHADDLAARIASASPSSLKSFVYGSTTSVFGRPVDPSEWVDETTPPRDLADRARARLDIERALAKVGLPLKVVRIAGIYGPGRTMRDAIRKEQLILFEGGPPTSRIHVEDLARILEAMTEPSAPPLIIACDDEPAETLEVARYTCRLLGLEAPEPVSVEDARRVLSPMALEMRLGGHRCRSLVRPKLIGRLTYPTYREGVRASLEAEGALPVPA
ncbi:MAG: NAD(P)H-binding protein [Deltaproteobacteria bacterium]|nr:NAD(P)H-binding protein [Deltaproteobacteria bacterium]